MRTVAVACLAVLASQGCAFMPYHEQQYASRSSTVFISGFVTKPNIPVEIHVQAWENQAACAQVDGESHWQSLGTTYSHAKPVLDSSQAVWYQFWAAKVIPNANWCLLPSGPDSLFGPPMYGTHISTRYFDNGWHINQTVAEGWQTCAEKQNGSGGAIVLECTRKGEDNHAVRIWATP